MEQLTLKELAPYLPYGLKALFVDKHIIEIKGAALDSRKGLCVFWDSCIDEVRKIKPILRPLSDLKQKYKRKLSFDGQNYLVDNGFDADALEYLGYNDIQKLFEWHFDVFGLIEKGLAIDINTLKQ